MVRLMVGGLPVGFFFMGLGLPISVINPIGHSEFSEIMLYIWFEGAFHWKPP
jgi:hypothetical protein